MIWTIFTIWLAFVILCTIIEEKTEEGFFGILMLISFPIMLYLPFFIK